MKISESIPYDYDSKLKSLIWFGDVAKFLLNSKHISHLKSLMDSIEELNEGKIDMFKLKANIVKFKEEQFIVELERYIMNNNVIKLPSILINILDN